MIEDQQKAIQQLMRLQGSGLQYSIENYTSGLSELTVRAFIPGASDKEVVRITFQTVLFMQLPTSWKNSDFQLASLEKQQELLDLFSINKEVQDYVHLLLFTTIPNSSPEVFILCHKVFISQEIPLT